MSLFPFHFPSNSICLQPANNLPLFMIQGRFIDISTEVAVTAASNQLVIVHDADA
jgi:hypothetical protein